MTSDRFSPAEYGRLLAESAPPLTPHQIEAAARILASVAGERSFTIAGAAELKSVSPDYIRQAIHRTDRLALRARKVGRGYRIDASALEDWWRRLPDA